MFAYNKGVLVVPSAGNGRSEDSGHPASDVYSLSVAAEELRGLDVMNAGHHGTRAKNDLSPVMLVAASVGGTLRVIGLVVSGLMMFGGSEQPLQTQVAKNVSDGNSAATNKRGTRLSWKVFERTYSSGLLKVRMTHPEAGFESDIVVANKTTLRIQLTHVMNDERMREIREEAKQKCANVWRYVEAQEHRTLSGHWTTGTTKSTERLTTADSLAFQHNFDMFGNYREHLISNRNAKIHTEPDGVTRYWCPSRPGIEAEVIYGYDLGCDVRWARVSVILTTYRPHSGMCQ